MTLPHGPGHNGGPTMERGTSWRRVAWGKARAELLPQLPLNVIKRRVARAKELGLDYRTYATVHAASGRDIVAFLFSTNALRLLRHRDEVPAARAAKLRTLQHCETGLLTQPPFDADMLAMRLQAMQGLGFAPVTQAPPLAESWGETRARLRGMLRAARLDPDGVVIVGDTTLERGWSATASLAGHVPAARFFAAQ
ncbi:MAG: hypothetical protein ABNH26_06645 [Celeribacter sp.]|jgi:hypothetical protein